MQESPCSASPRTAGRLFGQMPLERNRLLIVKCLEIPISGVLFKPAQRLRSGIHRRLAVALGFLQISEIFALDSLIFRVVFSSWFLTPCLKSLFTVG